MLDPVLYAKLMMMMNSDRARRRLYQDSDKICDKAKLTAYLPLWADDIVPEPAGGLIKPSRLKGLKVYSYVKSYAEFRNQTLKKAADTYSCYKQRITPRVNLTS